MTSLHASTLAALHLVDGMKCCADNNLNPFEATKTPVSSTSDIPHVPECTDCDWCRAVVAREDLVEHLESCEVRRWAQHYERCQGGLA